MGIWKSFAGMVRAEIISAEPERTLQQLNQVGVQVFDVSYSKPLTVVTTIYRNQFKIAEQILQNLGCSVRVTERFGVYWAWRRLLHRPVLSVGLALLLCLWMYLPSRVLFIRVNGSSMVPEDLIIEKANSCGLTLGMARQNVRSEKVKNALLEQIPQLQWVGVNTVGCVATISVSEKKSEPDEQDSYEVSHIVALRDGVIDSCTVTKGNLLCQPGEAVVKGQILVSGYTDCGITISAERASAEIYAQTRRTQDSILLTEGAYRGKIVDKQVQYRLIVGKRQYDFPQLFWKKSSLPDCDCKKTVDAYILALPGGFSVPVTLLKETYTYYETEIRELDIELVRTRMSELTEQYTSLRMIGGSIVKKDEIYDAGEGYCCLSAAYLCRELIGMEVNVKTLP